MADITILPLCAPDLMGARALSLLQSADRLFLQTEKHPFAKAVTALGRPFKSMDALYEEAGDFDALSLAIAKSLVEAAPCVYAVTGHIGGTQIPVIETAAAEAGLSVEALPGIPLYAAAFPGKAIDGVCAATALWERIDPGMSLAVEEIDSAIAAGHVKLRLMEYFPDDWAILLADADEDGVFKAQSIALYELDRQKRYSATCCAFIPAAPPEALSRSGYEQLMAVMRKLRAPDGCPWDREQTHESLKQPLLEECYELLDAIDERDDTHLCEELGDVLLQVVFHCVIAEEQGRFTERDVTTALVNKLIFRHPHIFGAAQADTAEKVLVNWEKLKKIEKGQSTQTDALMSVPRGLPALTRSRKVQKKAADVGFDWDSAAAAFSKIAEETAELKSAMDADQHVEEEMGDLLFAVVNVARLLKLDPEFLLLAATDKFIRRFAAMEELAMREGRTLEDMTMMEMDACWERVKMTENGE